MAREAALTIRSRPSTRGLLEVPAPAVVEGHHEVQASAFRLGLGLGQGPADSGGQRGDVTHCAHPHAPAGEQAGVALQDRLEGPHHRQHLVSFPAPVLGRKQKGAHGPQAERGSVTDDAYKVFTGSRVAPLVGQAPRQGPAPIPVHD